MKMRQSFIVLYCVLRVLSKGRITIATFVRDDDASDVQNRSRPSDLDKDVVVVQKKKSTRSRRLRVAAAPCAPSRIWRFGAKQQQREGPMLEK